MSAAEHDLDVLKRFAPVFHLHPQEEFFPCSVDRFLAGAELLDAHTGQTELSPPLTSASLYQFSRRNQNSTDAFCLHLLDDSTDCIRSGNKSSWKSVPVYGRIVRRSDNTWVLTYTLFFGHHGPPSYLGFEQTSASHDADFQYVIVHVDRLSQTVRRVFFGRDGTEGSGIWRSPQTQGCSLFQRTHTHVYVALNTHGLYPKPAIYPRHFLMGSDKTAVRGRTWLPPVQWIVADSHPEFRADTMGWALAHVNWDESGVRPHTGYDAVGSGITYQVGLSRFQWALFVFTTDVAAAAWATVTTDSTFQRYGLLTGSVLTVLIVYALAFLSQEAIYYFAETQVVQRNDELEET